MAISKANLMACLKVIPRERQMVIWMVHLWASPKETKMDVCLVCSKVRLMVILMET